MPEALAVVALDAVLALGLVVLLAAPAALELLVLDEAADDSITVLEALEAALTTPAAPRPKTRGPILLFSLLLFLPEPPYLLLFLNIPSNSSLANSSTALKP